MTATGHAIVGTIIAAKIGNPILAVPIALASHIVADTIPHWDTATNRKNKTFKELFIHSFADVILGFTLSYLLIFWIFPETNLLYAFFMIIVSQFFDWATAPYYFFKVKTLNGPILFKKNSIRIWIYHGDWSHRLLLLE